MNKDTLGPLKIGQKVGKWLVIADAGKRGDWQRWLCRCDCGVERSVDAWSMRRGGSTSCGRCTMNRKGKGGRKQSPTSLSYTKDYGLWKQMVARCHNPKNTRYSYYGARGIVVCERWRNSFATFMGDMGPRPPKHSIERRNNNGNYEPLNCHWATQTEQMQNTRRSKRGATNKV